MVNTQKNLFIKINLFWNFTRSGSTGASLGHRPRPVLGEIAAIV